MAAGVRKAYFELGADPSKLDGTLTTSRAKLKKFGVQVGKDISGAIRGGFDTLSNIAGFGGIAGIAVATNQVLEFETRLSRLGVQSRSTAAQMAVMRDQIFDIANASGLGSSELLAGVEKFVSLTGDVNAAKMSLEGFATVAQATGASVEDVAASAAALSINMKIGGKDMQDALSVLAVQGKEGSIELKDLATQAAKLTPKFSFFKKQGVEGLQEMGALAQLMKSSFGSAEETTTGFNALLGAMISKRDDISGAGVQVFDDAGNLRAVSDIIFDLDKFAKENKEQPYLATISDILKDKEAIAAFVGVASKGRDAFDRLVGDAQKARTEIDGDFKRMMETPAAKIGQAKAKLEETFNALLVKHLDDIAGAMTKIAEAISWMADHKAAVAGIFLAMKGGGYLSSLAGVLGGAAGAAAAPGAAGAAATAAGAAGGAKGAKGAGAFVGALGNVIQGAAIGAIVNDTLARESDGMTKSIVQVSHAMAGLPGPLGLFGKAVAIGTDTILAAFAYLEAKVDQEQKQILAAHYGAFGIQRQGEWQQATQALEKGGQTAAGAATFEEQRDKAAMYFLGKAKESGALSTSEGGRLRLDEKVLDASLNQDATLTDSARRDIRQAIIDSVALGGGGSMGETDEDVMGFVKNTLGMNVQKVKVELAPIQLEIKDGNIVQATEQDRSIRKKGN